jgi:CDP-6-deoxy-D-xylo-4-hexulose-3-dehydrase
LDTEGQCNYAFIVILKNPSFPNRDLVEAELQKATIEFRRGLSGGGSQIKQPYIRERFQIDESQFPNIEHVHHYAWYIGNYPSLSFAKVQQLVKILNGINII